MRMRTSFSLINPPDNLRNIDNTPLALRTNITNNLPIPVIGEIVNVTANKGWKLHGIFNVRGVVTDIQKFYRSDYLLVVIYIEEIR